MATPMTNSNTIDFDSAKRLARSRNVDFEKELEKDTHQQLRLRLSSVLQSSLDLEQVLNIFLGELQTVMELSGLTYINENQKIKMHSGKKATHSCGYRLITQQDHLGEITLYRGKRFAEADLELTEEVLSNLICPLRNALQYREAIIASLTDPLTGAGNRLALDNTLSREIELSRRHASPLSLLLIDVDDSSKLTTSTGTAVATWR